MVTGYSNTVNAFQQTTSTGSNWVVQYITTSSTTGLSGWPWQDWTIVRAMYDRPRIVGAPWWSNVTVEDPWRPAAPAVIRGLRRTQERLAAELERTARQLEEQRQMAAARARQLLLGELDPVQRAQFAAEGWFVVKGRRGRRYRIRPAVSANIDVLGRRGEAVRERLCVHPAGAWRMPVEDVMLAQLLHLRDNEAGLLRIANHHPALAPA
jgi:hypothetical protein